MEMQLERGGKNLIRYYGPGLIGVNDAEYRSSVLITQYDVVAPWYSGELDQLTVDAFVHLLDQPESSRHDIVLLGTGKRYQRAPLELVTALAHHGLSLEMMDTRAACRTFSVLTGENRLVAAALLPINE